MRSSETEGRDDVDPAGPTPRDDIRPLSRARKTAFIAITLLGSTAIWVVLAELAFRIFDIGPEINPVWHGNYRLSRNPVLRYELEPGSKAGRSNINSHGMRDREYDLEKPAGTFRIAVIGDSIAYGFSLPERWSFSAQLEELLNNHYRSGDEPAIEVLNFGVTGYSFTQVMEALRSRALAFDPDLVIYAYSLNDPQEYSMEMSNLVAQLTEAEETYLVLDGQQRFAHRSRLYRLIRYLVAQQFSKPREFAS